MNLLRIISTVLILVFILVLVACNENEPKMSADVTDGASESNEPATDISTDKTTEATEEGIEYNCEEGIHAYTKSNTCDACGYTIPVTEGLGFISYNKKECGVRPSVANPEGEVYIPAIHNGKRVVAIESNSFKEMQKLTSVHIPSTVKEIKEYAFLSCVNLQSVDISNGVEIIGEGAFYNCVALESITVPKSVTSIGKSFFEGAVALTSLEVDKENTVYHSADNCIIETAAKTLIAGCKTSIIPSDGSVTSIGPCAFQYCELTDVVIPEGITSIGEKAFANVRYTKMSLPNSLTSIGKSGLSFEDGAEYNEYGDAYYLGNEANPYVVLMLAKNDITVCDIHEQTKIINAHAFDSKQGLKSIKIPDGVVAIGEGAFSFCKSVTSIVVGNRVTAIGDSAFSCCYSVEKVTIGKNVKSIGKNAFFECSDMKTITFMGNRTAWAKIEKGEDWDYHYYLSVPGNMTVPLVKIEYEIIYRG